MTSQNERRKIPFEAFRPTPIFVALLLSLSLTDTLPVACAQLKAPAATAPVRLGMSRELSTNAPTERGDSSTYLSAYHMEATPNERIVLTDQAEVRKGGAVLRGDQITYTFSTDEVYANGNALIARSGAIMEGPELTYRLDAQTGFMPEAKFKYTPYQLRGNSDRVDMLGDNKAKFCNALITTCVEGDKSWWIEANELEIDQTEEVAEGKHAVLYLGGVPVVYTPYLTFPTGMGRRTGFLAPKVGLNSNLGLNMEIPFYWNIAPNYDYTLNIRPMSQRGLMLGNTFRYLQPTFGGEVKYDYMFHDRDANRDRYLIGWKHTQRLWGGVNLGINYQRASDNNYIDDFSTDLRTSSQDILPQNIWLSYGQTYWSTSLGVYKNQTLRPNESWTEQPYMKEPEFNLRGYVADFHGVELSSNFKATHFKPGDNYTTKGRPIGKTRSGEGNRFMLNSSVTYPLVGSFWFLKPKFEYNIAYYNDIDGYKWNSGSVDIYKNSHRALPIYSVDGGLVFERNTVLLDRATEQTLEPRLFYAYIPYRNQTHLPNFDSSEADMNLAQLFTPYRFIGNDRIANANQLTAAVTSRYIDSESGKEWFNFTVGQRYYFEDQKVGLYWSPASTANSNKRSDIVGLTEFTLIKDVRLEAGAQWSTLWRKFSKASAGVRYSPKKYSTVSLYYRYNFDPYDTSEDINENDNLNQIDFAFQWPISDNWFALGRYNWSIRDSKPIESLFGFEYRAGCWIFRSALQRYVKGNGRYSTNVFFELQLIGLGGVGSSPIETLSKGIIGYEPVEPRPIQVGRYDYYE